MHILVSNILDLMPDDDSVEMDEVSYDEVEHVDGEFATVWTPYRFYEDGKVGLGLLLLMGEGLLVRWSLGRGWRCRWWGRLLF